jgi:hypothetical protein
MEQKNTDLTLDLQDLNVEDVEILAQDGSHGVPDFATSTGSSGSTGINSCVIDQ